MPARTPPDAPAQAARFVAADHRARVAVLVVTYDSARDVDALLDSLRSEAARVPLRVLVADNSSTDDTLARLAEHPDVTVVPTGGNLGYAGGLNTLLPLVGDVDAVLVLNPDLTVRPGAVEALLDRLDDPRVGAVVPTVLEPDGTPYPSLRREPTVLRTLGDALVGRRLPGRPSWASETDRTPGHYTTAHPVDWATGAALLVRAATVRALGPWDERYFLYSEETDYLRRLRDLGQQVWFEPTAQVVHSRGGSGSSPALVALQEANRVRYARVHGSALHAGLVRAVLVLKSTLRVRDAGHRAALRSLLDGTLLAHPHVRPEAPRDTGDSAGPGRAAPGGSVVIPAHDEASVIARTLRPLAAEAADGLLEVVVVCNGCTDDTADIARTFPGVTVVEIATASKAAALRAGDRTASRFPRLYLDADIELSPGGATTLLAALDRPGVHAARPTTVDDLTGATWPVRAFYRVRSRIPALHEHLWGAGAYALDASVRARLGEFPDVTADDLWVDRHVAADEKMRVAEVSVVVRRPRDTRSLLAVLRRTRRTEPTAAGTGAAPTTGGTRTIGSADVLRTVRGPRSLVDAATYVTLVTLARAQLTRTPGSRWERDESSR